MRVLLVEDDRRVASFIRRGLVQEGFSVDVSADGRDAFHQALHEPYDVIVLDILIPFMDGFEVLRQVRAQGCGVPVLILSAKDAVEERVRGLNTGADDYLVKPFSFPELTARIRALLRRRSDQGQAVVRVGDLDMDAAARKVARGGRRINLTPREFSLLEYLVRNRGSVLTRTMIAEHVWDQHFDTFTNVIDVYIRYLRAKVDDPFPSKLIHTIRGVGYVLSEEAP
ncbi:MAG TPA: heavy metal response regulator transcription factor [Vicinamibacteria bacterium]|nr:heavy metal response regulator transcription factor [Vicinamibacteria bacterium]